MLLLSPYVCSSDTGRQCTAQLDYHHQLRIIRSTRISHTATPIYGIYPGQSEGDVEGFTSEVNAVISASNLFNPASIDQDREYIGAVLERNGKYFYTVGAGDRAQDAVEIRLRIPASYTIISFWHTHGAPAYKRVFFSETDRRLVEIYKKPLYLADFTGNLKVLFPADDSSHSDDHARRTRDGFLHGSPVRSATGEALNVCISFNA